jgi:hypothetical protein
MRYQASLYQGEEQQLINGGVETLMQTAIKVLERTEPKAPRRITDRRGRR